MLQDLFPHLTLFAVGLLAGTVNILAGGGSLLTLPVMIFLGLPPTTANGTLRAGILIQNLGGVWGFQRRGFVERSILGVALPPALVGAGVGTLMGVMVGDVAFQRILALVMVLLVLWTLWNPVERRQSRRRRQESPPHGTLPHGDSSQGGPSGDALPDEPSMPAWAQALGFFLVGVYGGFIQAGIGFLILALTSAAGLDLVRGNALKILLVLLFTPVALAGYALAGLVDWGLGLALGAGSFLGAQVGVHLAVKRGHRWIRRVVTVLVILFALRLWFFG